MKLFSGNIHLLENALGYSSLNQKAIAQNIANVDVPNYKRKEVSFKQMLSEASGKPLNAYRSDPRHFHIQANSEHTSMYEVKQQTYHHNGNNVDIDKEMSDLAANQIYYQALVERINGKFSTLQNVIRGGK
ncbi:flagellar basal body rod protein FlgB [Bacillus sp. FJAT-50079]|uniref:flagellar basal body rod protein FlgB n=1 Tax=Bacillus sp. FJAT-50079 TaxID=2833577 RepID=UPI001BC927E1|nr:flagellar basal body rod protein FlgB [Bacillus sp. FJAT-50079]MBS4207630.1 flagellar basal body rod protein FlgB [Bacillus sp. FJAT-50079]